MQRQWSFVTHTPYTQDTQIAVSNSKIVFYKTKLNILKLYDVTLETNFVLSMINSIKQMT